MTDSNIHEADVHDLSLDVVHALDQVDVKVLSYVQLRRLYAALMQVVDDVAGETERRSENDNVGDTVRVPIRATQKKNS